MGSGLIFASRYPITFSDHIALPYGEEVLIKGTMDYGEFVLQGAQVNVICVDSVAYTDTALCPASSRFVVVNTHFPEQKERGFRIRKAQLTVLIDYLKANSPTGHSETFWEMPLIVAGDYNIERYNYYGGDEYNMFFTPSDGYFGNDLAWSDVLVEKNHEGNSPTRPETTTYPVGPPNWFLGEKAGYPPLSLDYVMVASSNDFTPTAARVVQIPVPEETLLYLTRKLGKYPVNSKDSPGEPIVSDHDGILMTMERVSVEALTPPAYSTDYIGGTLAFPEWEDESVFHGSMQAIYDFWISSKANLIDSVLCEGDESSGWLTTKGVHNGCKAED